MTLEKRLEKLEKQNGPNGECKCPKRTRLILPDDFPGGRELYTGPNEGICEKCGGRWENIIIKIDWDEEKQEPVRKDIVGASYVE